MQKRLLIGLVLAAQLLGPGDVPSTTYGPTPIPIAPSPTDYVFSGKVIATLDPPLLRDTAIDGWGIRVQITEALSPPATQARVVDVYQTVNDWRFYRPDDGPSESEERALALGDQVFISGYETVYADSPGATPVIFAYWTLEQSNGFSNLSAANFGYRRELIRMMSEPSVATRHATLESQLYFPEATESGLREAVCQHLIDRYAADTGTADRLRAHCRPASERSDEAIRVLLTGSDLSRTYFAVHALRDDQDRAKRFVNELASVAKNASGLTRLTAVELLTELDAATALDADICDRLLSDPDPVIRERALWVPPALYCSDRPAPLIRMILDESSERTARSSMGYAAWDRPGFREALERRLDLWNPHHSARLVQLVQSLLDDLESRARRAELEVRSSTPSAEDRDQERKVERRAASLRQIKLLHNLQSPRSSKAIRALRQLLMLQSSGEYIRKPFDRLIGGRLLTLSRHPDPRVRILAVRAIASDISEMPKPLLSALITLTSDQDWRVRENAIAALQLQGPTDWVRLRLASHLTSPVPAERGAAILLLERFLPAPKSDSGRLAYLAPYIPTLERIASQDLQPLRCQAALLLGFLTPAFNPGELDDPRCEARLATQAVELGASNTNDLVRQALIAVRAEELPLEYPWLPSSVRELKAFEARWNEDEHTVDELLDHALSNGSKGDGVAVVGLLERITRPQRSTVPLLLKALGSDHAAVRHRAELLARTKLAGVPAIASALRHAQEQAASPLRVRTSQR